MFSMFNSNPAIINNNYYPLQFVLSYIQDHVSKYEDILAMMSSKIHPTYHAYPVRALLKNELLDRDLDKYAYVLALIYLKNKEFYRDMPNICKGTKYNAPYAEEKCLMM